MGLGGSTSSVRLREIDGMVMRVGRERGETRISSRKDDQTPTLSRIYSACCELRGLSKKHCLSKTDGRSWVPGRGKGGAYSGRNVSKQTLDDVWISGGNTRHQSKHSQLNRYPMSNSRTTKCRKKGVERVWGRQLKDYTILRIPMVLAGEELREARGDRVGERGSKRVR